MWICIGIPLVIGVVIALAARCGLPRDQNPYFTEAGEPRSW
jgi:small basic protein